MKRSIRSRRGTCISVTIAAALAATGLHLVPSAPAEAAPRVEVFSNSQVTLRLEFLDDDLVHLELAAGSATAGTIPVSPQVSKTDYPGPSVYERRQNEMVTANLSVNVDPATLCVTTRDISRDPAWVLNTTCPRNMTQAWKGLTFTKEGSTHAYGLGEQFRMGGQADGDLVGRTRTAGGPFGNAMAWDSDNGPVGNAQIPVLYALGSGTSGYAIFTDSNYKQEWNLTGDPWSFETFGDQLRWFIMQGPSLADLRSDYLELTGRSPVPPKKAFGLWTSEFGWDDWGELDRNLAGLRADGFPTDGAMLDVTWFGGVTGGSDYSRMGSLEWDPAKFPDPASKIASLKASGVGVIPIEEPYVSRGLAAHAELANRGHLVRAGCGTCQPVYLTGNDWWGRGGMIDFTSPAASAYWHDSKRKPLVGQGVLGHWLDLGEPEMYDPGDWVQGVVPGKHSHADYHNYYNLAWAQSVKDGYARQGSKQRPFILTRSGAAGIQRTGAALWSGDIGSRLRALAAQQNVQMHMSMSGIDYFGSDIGGFRREMADTDVAEMYTQWFANSAWFDVPVRPHTENLCNCLPSSPNTIGHKASNLANIQRRYALTPYYYSLAHRAWTAGEALIPPMVLNYQTDPNVRKIGSQKMIGKNLLIGIVAGKGERQRNMYLPADEWYDYHSNQLIKSRGEWVNNVPLWRNGTFTLPAYARAGAIIPTMFVDDKTKTVDGARADGTSHPELIVKVYQGGGTSSFALAEDDGTTTNYQGGAVRLTQLSQSSSETQTSVTIGAAKGTFTGAAASRPNVVQLVTDHQATSVSLNGAKLTKHATKSAFDHAASGWYNAGGNLVVAKTASLSVTSVKTLVFATDEANVTATFTCHNGTTTPGQSVYVVGNVPQLGSWNPSSSVKLEPSAYPTWTGRVSGLPPAAAIEWKCIKRVEADYPDVADLWEAGPNNVFTTPASGEASPPAGDFGS